MCWKFKPVLLALAGIGCSAFIFLLSFPNLLFPRGWPFFLCFFLCPFLAVSGTCQGFKRFGHGLLLGLSMYGLLVLWLFPVHPTGYIFFVLLLSVQPLLFCLFYTDPRKYFSTKRVFPPPGRKAFAGVLVFFSLLYLPSLWVMSEYLRTICLQGFSWSIAYGLSSFPGVLTIDRYTGSYGVSFILVLLNVLIFLAFKEKQARRTAAATGLLVLAVYGLSYLAFKTDGVSMEAQDSAVFRFCSIQPGLDVRDKSQLKNLTAIMDTNIALSLQCAQGRPVDLIVWPETAVPDDVIRNRSINDRVRKLAQTLNTHLMIGSALELDRHDYNSAVFFDPQGQARGFCHKIKRIPFAEYHPDFLKHGLLKRLPVPKGYDFHPGKRVCSFPLAAQEHEGRCRLGSIICSEEFYPGLLRRVKNAGNDGIVTLLNDQWFPPPAKRLHWQAAVMRAVELGVPVLRSANDGITDWIDGQGRSQHFRKPAAATGQDIHYFVVPIKKQWTFYQKYGDVFARICCVFVIIFMFLDRVGMKA